MLRQKGPSIPLKWAVISVMVVAIGVAVGYAVVEYWSPVSPTQHGQYTLPNGQPFCYPWQQGCNHSPAIDLKQSSSVYTRPLRRAGP
ncbi:MAG: hypothetical protein KGI33_03305 [Thaumarchaeota archaeon]|nr:hypothetical protein [Nitrososphaerota archaeon]